ncbi:MAG: SoxR reducing system RseC family protein [Alistipes sp.]|nr:SoxR reducing system RseC family protein [Alistipes sp.]
MDRIEHSGVVTRVDAGRVFVEVTAQGACGSCRAREACGQGEAKRKIVEVNTPRAAGYRVGEQVTVGVSRRIGAVAVAVAYLLPLAVLVAVLAVCTAAGAGEGATLCAALGAVAGYYGVLWPLRRRIESKVHFTISKTV